MARRDLSRQATVSHSFALSFSVSFFWTGAPSYGRPHSSSAIYDTTEGICSKVCRTLISQHNKTSRAKFKETKISATTSCAHSNRMIESKPRGNGNGLLSSSQSSSQRRLEIYYGLTLADWDHIYIYDRNRRDCSPCVIEEVWKKLPYRKSSREKYTTSVYMVVGHYVQCCNILTSLLFLRPYTMYCINIYVLCTGTIYTNI